VATDAAGSERSRDGYAAATAPARWVLVAAPAIVVAALALFVFIAEDVLDGGGLISRDESVLHWFVDHRTDALVRAAKVAGVIGSFVPLAVAALVVGAVLWRRGWSLVLAAAPIVSLCLAGLASTIAKTAFDRPRPPAEFRAVDVTLAAFPSGHATDAAAFFLATAFVLAITVTRRRAVQAVLVAVGAVCALLIGVSRLVLGVHWLSDVVAGWSLGTAAAVAIVVAAWTWTTRDRQTMPRRASAP